MVYVGPSLFGCRQRPSKDAAQCPIEPNYHPVRLRMQRRCPQQCHGLEPVNGTQIVVSMTTH